MLGGLRSACWSPWISISILIALGSSLCSALRRPWEKKNMVDLKQQLDVLDYFGPIVVFAAFLAIVFIISVTCILWFCVSDTDDVTVFSKWRAGRQRRQYDVAETKRDE